MYRRKVVPAKQATRIATELAHIYNQASDTFLTRKGDITRVKALRPSQLPFCPIDFFIRHATFGALQVLDMRGAFYTSMGTTVHEVLQSYLGKSGRFLANWKCKQCGKHYKVSMQHECCDFSMEYHEIEINYKGVVGHIDAVFQDAAGNYWIVDFKTTSVKGAPLKLKKPGIGYVEQVEAYALMLKLEHKIVVKGVVLMFVRRDNPAEPVIWSKELTANDYKIIMARMRHYKALHKEVLNVKTLQEALALKAHGKCKSLWCKTCRSSTPVGANIKKAHARGVAMKRLPLISLT